MKTVFQSILSLLVLLASVQFVSATTNPLPPSKSTPVLVKVNSPAPNAFTVRLANLQEEPTAVILKDQYGQTYFQKNIKDHNGYVLRVDMEKAPQGRYFLHTTQGDEEVVVVLYRRSDNILVSDSRRI